MSVFQNSRKLVEDIETVRKTLRDEHFPYEEGLRVYEALHEGLRVMGDQAESFFKWSVQFPNDALSTDQKHHLHMLELTVKRIKETLG